MKRTWVLGLALIVVMAFGLTGCVTFPSLTVSPVVPAANEQIIRDQLIILTDATDSFGVFDKFEYEKALVQAFVGSMPDGTYLSGLNSFAGTPPPTWMKNPLAPYCREGMNKSAGCLKWLGGNTPLSCALKSLKKDVEGKAGRGALLVFSDGEVFSRAAVLDACKELKAAHGGELCIFTVHIGNCSCGKQLMSDMVSVTGCGKAYDGYTLNNLAAIQGLVRDIFFGPKAAPAPGPVDSDGDGVYDDKDQCPGTPKGAKVDERGCWVLKNVNFDNDSAVIKPEFTAELDEVAGVLKNNPNVRISVDGHTDSNASDEYNLKLSERRAAAVKDALIQRGIDAARLEAKGFGESKPMAPNDSPENMYKNRRVELSVL
ncbi:MAG TPA: OmpA family protein [Candidatus Hydrogenedentes bacterium]|nr:OmpA family protein [Candidatus Hydrogenedentota bacterium]